MNQILELNKIYNENCLQTMKRMPDGFVDLTLTDFPYGNNTDYENYEDTENNLIKLVSDVMPEILRVSKRALITCGISNIRLFPKSEWTLLWVSSAGIGSSKWGFACWQPILAYGKDPYLQNSMGRRPDTIFSNESSGDSNHPCPKPLELWKRVLIRGSVKETDLIYDPFMGSGTTAIVTHLTKRNWIGSEISSEYVDLANKRLDPYLRQENLF